MQITLVGSNTDRTQQSRSLLLHSRRHRYPQATYGFALRRNFRCNGTSVRRLLLHAH